MEILILCKKLGNSEKSWFALSRNVGNTCRLFVVFQRILAIFNVSRPFYRNERNFTFLSISGAQRRLSGPESVFWETGSEPFINVSSWEVFWRPRTGKVRFGPKRLEFRSDTGFSRKKRYSRKKCKFREKVENYPKCYIFALKRCSRWM